MTPEPAEHERVAVLAALAEARSEEPAELDPWTAAAIREATEREPEP